MSESIPTVYVPPILVLTAPLFCSGRDSGLGTGGGWSNDGPEPADGLRLEGVSVMVEGRTSPVLSGVDLHAPAGSVVAVLGEAGAGKVWTRVSRFVALVLGAVDNERCTCCSRRKLGRDIGTCSNASCINMSG